MNIYFATLPVLRRFPKTQAAKETALLIVIQPFKI